MWISTVTGTPGQGQAGYKNTCRQGVHYKLCGTIWSAAAAFKENGPLVGWAQRGEHLVVGVGGDRSRKEAERVAAQVANPTAVAVRANTVYITDAAYFTQDDPNLLTAHLER